MQFFFPQMSYSLMSGSQMKKRQIQKGKKGGWPFKYPGYHFSQRGRGLQQWGQAQQWLLPLCVSVIGSSNQQWEHRFFLSILQFTQLCASCSRDTPTTSNYWLRVVHRLLLLCLHLKLTKINHNSLSQVFSQKLQAFNKLWSSKTVILDRFYQFNYCVGGETDFWCFLPHHLLRIFS